MVPAGRVPGWPPMTCMHSLALLRAQGPSPGRPMLPSCGQLPAAHATYRPWAVARAPGVKAMMTSQCPGLRRAAVSPAPATPVVSFQRGQRGHL